MTRHIREHGWDNTPLGPIGRWSPRLRTLTALALDSPVATVLLWGPTLIQIYNDRWRVLMDGKHPAALGQPTHDCFPEIMDVMVPLYERVRRGEPVVLTDSLLPVSRRGAVEDAWWNVQYLPVADDSGSVAGMLCTVVETTAGVLAERERARTEIMLQESEERFRHAFEIETIGVTFWKSDEAYALTGTNAAFCRMLGCSREDVVGRTLLDLTMPGFHDVSRGHIAALERTGVLPPHEKQFRRLDGTPVWALCSGRMIGGELFKFILDVDERHRTATALAESEQRLRTLMEGVPQLVWRADAAGDWTWAGPQWLAYTGQTREQSLGTGWLDAMPPDERAAAREAWRDAAADGLLQFDHRIRHGGTGRYSWFQTRGVPVHDADGGIIEWLGTCTDIDAQVRAREVLSRSGEELERQVAARTGELMAAEMRLRQSEKLNAIGQLTAGIAHDFNNMLHALGSSFDTMRFLLDHGEHDGLASYLDRAEGAADRAAILVRRMLAFSRQQPLEPRAVNVNRVVLGMEELVRRSIGPGVRLELRLLDGAWLAWCDPGQLENALLNLCINARDAMPDGGWLTINTEEVELSAQQAAFHADAIPGRYISLSVSDTGTGIPADVVDRVFEPFFTTRSIGGGTGLGLSQVHGFVRQSGGFVELDTSVEPGPGCGTTVRMRFPFHAENPETDRPQLVSLTGPTILLVEDEATIRLSTADYLRRNGYRVLDAENGPEAARLVETGVSIDFLVTDQGMPGGMTGMELIRRTRERHPDLPTLLVTGFSGVAEEPDVLMLRKPYRMPQLLEVIRLNLRGGR